MEHLSEIIKQDTKAAIQAFRAEDFDSTNTFANRAMANAIMGNDKKLILPGFFMKDLATSYGIIKVHRGSALSTAKAVGNKHIKSLEEMLDKQELSEKELWNLFYKLNLDVKDFLKDDFEKDAYKSDDHEFSHEAFAWLLNYMKENKTILTNANNFLLKGIVNEMDRIFKVHGGFESEIYATSLVKALDRHYDYFRYAYQKDGIIDEDKVKTTVFPYVDKIADICLSTEINISDVMELLWKLVSEWRKFFVKYMELRPRGVAVEKAIQLPEEAKRKLTESVTRALEKEVKGK